MTEKSLVIISFLLNRNHFALNT